MILYRCGRLPPSTARLLLAAALFETRSDITIGRTFTNYLYA
jgi:hypothetical protein